MHLKDSVHLRYTPIQAVLTYESQYRCVSVKKMATAFFKIYRSFRRRSHSFFKRLSFSSSGFKCPCQESKRCLSSFFSCHFQRNMTPVSIPRRLSTSFDVISSSDAIRTASILNSRSYFLGIHASCSFLELGS